MTDDKDVLCGWATLLEGTPLEDERIEPANDALVQMVFFLYNFL